MARPEKIRIGSLLVQEKLISQEQLDLALEQQKQSGRKLGRVLVENINIAKRHTRPNAKNRQGGIVESEAAIHWSNVMLMCNKCMAPVRVKMHTLEDGQKKRICGKCNELIDA